MIHLSMHRFIATITLALSIGLVHAQVDPIWAVHYAEAGHATNVPVAMVTDSAGIVYVAGYTAGPGVTNGWLILKYSPAGSLLWHANYGGSTKGDCPAAMKLDNAGNLYVAGTVYNTASSNDIALVKFDSAGNLVWARQYIRAQGDDKANDMAFDSAGNIFVVGRGYRSTTCSFYGTPCYADTLYLTLKYDSAGNSLWVREFRDTGGNQDAQSVVVDSAGNAYVAGVAVGFADPRAPGYYFKVIKYAHNGTQLAIISPFQFPMTGDGLNVAIRAALGPANELYLAGITRLFYDRLWVTKYTNDNLAWMNYYYGFNAYAGTRQIQALAVDRQSNVYVLGSDPNTNNTSACLLMRYDPAGNLLWTNLHNRIQANAEYGAGLVLDTNGNPWVCSFSTGPTNSSAFCTMLYNPNGSLLWEADYLGQGFNANEPKALCINPNGAINVTGTSADSSGKAITTLQYAQTSSRITLTNGALSMIATSNPGSTNWLQVSPDLENWYDACSGVTGSNGICAFPCFNSLITNSTGFFRISYH